jgi:hypothetical protein
MIQHLTMAFACLALATLSYAQDEWLYAQTGNGLQVYDPQTGEHLQSDYFPGLYGGAGLIYDGGRLYMMSQNASAAPEHVVEIHPATSTWELIGNTGLNVPWAIAGLTLDPTTGEHYLIDYAGGIYEVDVDSGLVSFLVRMEAKVTIITAIAIDSHGVAYGFGTPSIWYHRPAMYRVDLQTGELERIGDIPGNPFHFTTLTFDSQDRLWGAGIGLWSNQDFRIYRIDLETLELHSTIALPEEWPSVHAIAFGPKPDVATYCESKTNSQGCAPSIGWKGHPSATANLGFSVSCTEVVGDAPGFLMLGFGGQASVPFQGGTLCLADPIERTPPQTSVGSGGCSGAWSLDVNTWLFSKFPLDPGARFTCQWWGRDPGLSGPMSSQLSDALEVVLLP